MQDHQLSNLRASLQEIVERSDAKLLKLLHAAATAYHEDDSASEISDEEAGEQLYRLIYTSARSESCDKNDLRDIIISSRKNNPPLGITGMLLHTEDRFLQVLEGPKDKVMILYDKISKDSRHGGSIKRYCEPVEKRYFADWNMAYKNIDVRTIEYNTIIPETHRKMYEDMLNGDVHSYRDEGMRVLKTFLAVA